MDKNKYGYGYVFIYDPNKKDFYISEGCKIIDCEMHKRTNKVFWVFKYDDTQEAYKKWIQRKYGDNENIKI